MSPTHTKELGAAEVLDARRTLSQVFSPLVPDLFGAGFGSHPCALPDALPLEKARIFSRAYQRMGDRDSVCHDLTSVGWMQEIMADRL
jgi:hypothetical protein